MASNTSDYHKWCTQSRLVITNSFVVELLYRTWWKVLFADSKQLYIVPYVWLHYTTVKCGYLMILTAVVKLASANDNNTAVKLFVRKDDR